MPRLARAGLKGNSASKMRVLGEHSNKLLTEAEKHPRLKPTRHPFRPLSPQRTAARAGSAKVTAAKPLAVEASWAHPESPPPRSKAGEGEAAAFRPLTPEDEGLKAMKKVNSDLDELELRFLAAKERRKVGAEAVVAGEANGGGVPAVAVPAPAEPSPLADMPQTNESPPRQAAAPQSPLSGTLLDETLPDENDPDYPPHAFDEYDDEEAEAELGPFACAMQDHPDPVLAFLQLSGLSQYALTFKKEKIEVFMLGELQARHLKDLGLRGNDIETFKNKRLEMALQLGLEITEAMHEL